MVVVELAACQELNLEQGTRYSNKHSRAYPGQTQMPRMLYV